ncbi:MAG: chemotaxis protein CheW [Deltaproteobacteria bacterium]|nr:chemotaxis protein CheW [Deltaproteobacteria bacterium]
MKSAAKLQLLCFRVGGRAFGVDIMAIREILRNQKFTPVPHMPPSVAGVLNLRGDLIAVVDMHRVLLRENVSTGAEDSKLVVVCARGRTLGLLVDQVLDVVSVGVESLMPIPAGTRDPNPVVLGAFRREEGSGEVAVLVRLGALIEGDPEPCLEEAGLG